MAEPDAEDPDTTPVKPIPDLRFTSADQGGVRVTRDLSGQGHLARGSSTNMSSMKFSMRAQPRQELDPELQALRPRNEPPPAAVVAATPEVPPEATPEAVPAPGAPDSSTAPGGILSAIKRLFF